MHKQQHPPHPLKIALILLLILTFLFCGWKVLSLLSQSDQGEQAEPGGTVPSKTVVANGVEYYPRQDITTVLLIGVDKIGTMQDSGSYDNEGKADMLALAIFDNTNQDFRILLLNRDTMTDLPTLSVTGTPMDTVRGQLALAYTYGSGLEDSAENTKKAVSSLLNNIQIDHYFAMNLDAIELLTDAVGGVEVQVTDDFSAVDPTITQGSVLLNGRQARHFIQSRKDVGDQLNLSRMERHKEYMAGFMESFGKQVHQSGSFALKTYNEVADYMVTDCSATTLNSLASRYSDFPLKDVHTVAGTNTTDGTYIQFIPDEEALTDLVLSLFYSEKNL